MRMIHTKRKPMEPGNDLGAKPGVSGAFVPLSPQRERWGRRVAQSCVGVCWFVHLVVFPLLYFKIYSDGSGVFSNRALGILLPLGIVIAMLLGVGRLVANFLTSREDNMSYRAMILFFIGMVGQGVLIVILSLILR